jgi:3-hydroxyisobutyrate dehydrogenase-like beta-hydroxyacid dehydrogenase
MNEARASAASTLGLLYPGELGAAVARRLVAAGWQVVSPLQGRSERSLRRAREARVEDCTSLEACLSRSDLLLSVVPQHAVVQTAEAVAAAATRVDRRPVYVEGDSVSPQTMRTVDAVLAAAGVECVDGAFVGSAAMLGDKTTLYLSGAAAQRVADSIGDALTTRVIDGEVGLASAFKLAFAAFNKGLVALTLQVVTAVDAIGQREELLRALRLFYPGTMNTIERLLPTYPSHAARRAEEMEELLAWLDEIGRSTTLPEGVREVIDALARLELPSDSEWTAAGVLEACGRLGLLSRTSRTSRQ